MYAEERQQAMARARRRARPHVGQPTRGAVRRHHRDGPPRPVRAGADGPGPEGARRGGPRERADRHRVRSGRARLGQHAEKDRIAKAALDLLPPPGSTVLIDAGSTTSGWPSLLPRDHRLTVVTHSVPVAARLAGNPQIELHLLPGRVRSTTQAAVGAETVRALSRPAGRHRLPRDERHHRRPRPLHPRPRRGGHQARDRRQRPPGRRPRRREQGRRGVARSGSRDSTRSTCSSPTTAISAADRTRARRGRASRSWSHDPHPDPQPEHRPHGRRSPSR